METNAQVAEVVKDLMVDCLNVDRDELGPSVRFFNDLGGESIDMLDLQFRCEKRFGVKVDLQHMLGDTVEIDETGRVLPTSLEQLRKKFPFLDTDLLEPSPMAEDLKKLITVDAITHVVQATVARSAA